MLDREEIAVKGREVVGVVRRAVQEGQVSRVIVRDAKGDSVVDLPVTFAVLGAFLSPFLMGLALSFGYFRDYRVEIQRR